MRIYIEIFFSFYKGKHVCCFDEKDYTFGTIILKRTYIYLQNKYRNRDYSKAWKKKNYRQLKIHKQNESSLDLKTAKLTRNPLIFLSRLGRARSARSRLFHILNCLGDLVSLSLSFSLICSRICARALYVRARRAHAFSRGWEFRAPRVSAARIAQPRRRTVWNSAMDGGGVAQGSRLIFQAETLCESFI